MCLNGGTLFVCDRCPRVVCKQHFEILADFDISVSHFICVACHVDIYGKTPTPYYVRNTTFINIHILTCRQGFYKGPVNNLERPPDQWIPSLDNPLPFNGMYQMSIKSRVISEPLLILHFMLTKMDPTASPANLVAEYLKPYLPGDNRLLLQTIMFDFSTPGLIAEHKKQMVSLVKSLEQ